VYVSSHVYNYWTTPVWSNVWYLSFSLCMIWFKLLSICREIQHGQHSTLPVIK
jgi:hypothetical protein